MTTFIWREASQNYNLGLNKFMTKTRDLFANLKFTDLLFYHMGMICIHFIPLNMP